MTFQQFLLILRARLWVVVAIAGGVTALTLLVSLVLPKQYTATAQLVVDMKTTDPLSGASQMLLGYLATQVDIIDSERVAVRVVTMTGMDKPPKDGSPDKLREKWLDETDGIGGDAGYQVWLATFLRKGLDVRPSTTRESNAITIKYKADHPVKAAIIANAFAQAYKETNIALKTGSAMEYKDWFNTQTKKVREDLEIAQRRLSAYEQEHGVLAGDGRFDFESMLLTELNSQLSAAQGMGADSSSRQSHAGTAESLPEVMANPVVGSLKTELARLEADRSQLSARLGPNHPQIREISEKIKGQTQKLEMETQRVASSLGTTSLVSADRIKNLTEAIDKQRARVLELKKHRDQIAVFQRDIDNAQKAYDLVTQRLAFVTLESQTQQTNVSVLTPATPPVEHSSPLVVLNTVVAMFLGILLGTGVALVLEMRDQRVRGIEDLLQNLEIPLLGVIPGLNKPRSGIHFSRRPAIA
jgi:chain length determinant protein EpsF